jgi:hypothetical protein
MNAWIGTALALAALLAGGAFFGWKGIVFATTGIVFWLLLQMSRLMRLMQKAGAAPMGSVANAVMLSTKLQAGMKLVEVITLTGSLGQKQDDDSYVWRDSGGDAVEMVLRKGKLVEWRLIRATDGDATS